MERKPDIVCVSSIDWDFIWQGHQEIMSTLAASGNRVLFVENTGVRAPSIRELYISGIHFAIGGPFNNTFVPNPNLKPESTQTWEGGLRFAFEDLLMEGDGLKITQMRLGPARLTFTKMIFNLQSGDKAQLPINKAVY